MKVIVQEICKDISIDKNDDVPSITEIRHTDNYGIQHANDDEILLESSSIVPFIKAIEMSEEQMLELGKYLINKAEWYSVKDCDHLYEEIVDEDILYLCKNCGHTPENLERLTKQFGSE